MIISYDVYVRLPAFEASKSTVSGDGASIVFRKVKLLEPLEVRDSQNRVSVKMPNCEFNEARVTFTTKVKKIVGTDQVQGETTMNIRFKEKGGNALYLIKQATNVPSVYRDLRSRGFSREICDYVSMCHSKRELPNLQTLVKKYDLSDNSSRNISAFLRSGKIECLEGE